MVQLFFYSQYITMNFFVFLLNNKCLGHNIVSLLAYAYCLGLTLSESWLCISTTNNHKIYVNPDRTKWDVHEVH